MQSLQPCFKPLSLYTAPRLHATGKIVARKTPSSGYQTHQDQDDLRRPAELLTPKSTF